MIWFPHIDNPNIYQSLRLIAKAPFAILSIKEILILKKYL